MTKCNVNNGYPQAPLVRTHHRGVQTASAFLCVHYQPMQVAHHLPLVVNDIFLSCYITVA